MIHAYFNTFVWLFGFYDRIFTLNFSQRWIQDFPDGGPQPQPIILEIFPDNCIKLKKIGPRGAHP